jgi:hypothetical protein
MQFMQFIFKIIGFISIALMIFSVYIMIKSMRRDQRIKVRSLLIPVFSSLIFLVLYVVILKSVRLSPWSFLLGLVGLAAGILWSKTTLMSLKNNNVVGKRSPWYLVIWGVTIAVTQLLSMTASPGTVAIGISTIFFSTGLNIGTNSSLLVRRQKLVSGIQLQVKPVNASGIASKIDQELASSISLKQQGCPNCGKTNNSGLKFCVKCGQPLDRGLAPIISKPMLGNSCLNCGFPTQSGLKYCTRCGQKLAQKG